MEWNRNMKVTSCLLSLHKGQKISKYVPSLSNKSPRALGCSPPPKINDWTFLVSLHSLCRSNIKSRKCNNVSSCKRWKTTENSSLHDDTGLERETIYLKAAGWRFILLCLHHPFHLAALLVTFFVLTSEIECATIGLFFGPEGMCGKWPLLCTRERSPFLPPESDTIKLVHAFRLFSTPSKSL